MTVQRPFGITGRAAGVAHAHRHGFVGRKPGKILVRSINQIFIEKHVWQLIRSLTRRIEEDVVLNSLHVGRHLGKEGQQGAVNEDKSCLPHG